MPLEFSLQWHLTRSGSRSTVSSQISCDGSRKNGKTYETEPLWRGQFCKVSALMGQSCFENMRIPTQYLAGFNVKADLCILTAVILICTVEKNTFKDVWQLIRTKSGKFSLSCVCFCVSAYRLYTVVPKLVKFVDMLTNWYVRTNRRRLKVGWSVTLTSEQAISTHSVWFEGTLLCNTSIRSLKRSWVIDSLLFICYTMACVSLRLQSCFYSFVFYKQKNPSEGEVWKHKAKNFVLSL